MTLRDWRLRKGLTLAAAAQGVGAPDGSMVSKWERGEMIPGRAYMRAIYVESAGQVQPNDFYDLPKLRARAA